MKLPFVYESFDGVKHELTEAHVQYARKLAYEVGVETGELLTFDIRPWILYFAAVSIPGTVVEVLASWFPKPAPEGTPDQERDCVLGLISEKDMPEPME